MAFFIVEKIYVLGKLCVPLFSGHKRINRNMDLLGIAPLSLPLSMFGLKRTC